MDGVFVVFHNDCVVLNYVVTAFITWRQHLTLELNVCKAPVKG
jgi:hypothetical protein